MRVNVYAEEVDTDVERVTKSSQGKEFVGIRFYSTKGRQHYDAVTFWAPARDVGKKLMLKEAFLRALKLVED